jgi:hypothetical protein
MSRMLLPALAKVSSRDAEFTSRLRVAQAALAVERYRLSHDNALPLSLNDLAPAYLKSVPLDPCDGQPLRFKKLTKGYIVYAVGTDGSDDGGAEKLPAPGGTGGTSSGARPGFDITFTVER